ncbi:hypothetical protein Pcinc_023768 [Petrolisthes cinctipes]|uniref:Uncharacterized protein n=1 Tax=Petrolisthes cinctipes TaxID=88211 RepID=A0AAE1FB68_PETCI|nr:hypothetical protein Pcinc_023768 [Petrolisthes cinctipes]
MIDTYKFLHDRYDVDVAQIIPRRDLEREPRGNSVKIQHQYSRPSIRVNSFIPRIASVWNSLPEQVVAAPNLKAFETRLDKFWENRAVKFDFKARISEIRVPSTSITNPITDHHTIATEDLA